MQKTDWQIYYGKKRFHELRETYSRNYYYDSDGVSRYHTQLAKTFVMVENPNWRIWGDKEYLYGYILKQDNPAGMIEQNPDTFRKLPVPGVRNRSRRVKPKRRHGLMQERTHDDRGYGRSKRKCHINWWYDKWYDTEYHGSDYGQRNWKRTKKEKQWM